jgi:hypothetical protein
VCNIYTINKAEIEKIKNNHKGIDTEEHRRVIIDMPEGVCMRRHHIWKVGISLICRPSGCKVILIKAVRNRKTLWISNYTKSGQSCQNVGIVITSELLQHWSCRSSKCRSCLHCLHFDIRLHHEGLRTNCLNGPTLGRSMSKIPFIPFQIYTLIPSTAIPSLRLAISFWTDPQIRDAR